MIFIIDLNQGLNRCKSMI